VEAEKRYKNLSSTNNPFSFFYKKEKPLRNSASLFLSNGYGYEKTFFAFTTGNYFSHAHGANTYKIHNKQIIYFFYLKLFSV